MPAVITFWQRNRENRYQNVDFDLNFHILVTKTRKSLPEYFVDENGKIVNKTFTGIVKRLLRRPEDPDEEITCDYCCESERNADLHEVAKADFVSFFSKHSDACDICGSTDRC